MALVQQIEYRRAKFFGCPKPRTSVAGGGQAEDKISGEKI